LAVFFKTDENVSLQVVINSMRDNRILVEKSEGKNPLARYRRRWEENIKMHIKWL
jgi:hypothetical protein